MILKTFVLKHNRNRYMIYTNRLWKFPTVPDVDDGLHYGVTVIVDERERPRLVGDGQGELVVIY